MSDPLAKTDPKNEEEEKRRIEARREKQRRRREKNSEKYGDGYRFVLSRVRKLDSLKNCFQDLRVGKLSEDGQKVHNFRYMVNKFWGYIVQIITVVDSTVLYI